MVPPPVRKLDPKNLEAHAGTQCYSVPLVNGCENPRKDGGKARTSRLPFAKSTAKGSPFSMRGAPAQDYSGFRLKFQALPRCRRGIWRVAAEGSNNSRALSLSVKLSAVKLVFTSA
jgi:hypothetical protein